MDVVTRDRETTCHDGAVIRWKLPNRIERAFLLVREIIPTDAVTIESIQEGNVRETLEVSADIVTAACRIAVRQILVDGSPIDLPMRREPYGGVSVRLLDPEFAGDLIFDRYPDEMEQIAGEWCEALNGLTAEKKIDSNKLSPSLDSELSTGTIAKTGERGNGKAEPSASEQSDTTGATDRQQSTPAISAQ